MYVLPCYTKRGQIAARGREAGSQFHLACVLASLVLGSVNREGGAFTASSGTLRYCMFERRALRHMSVHLKT